MLNSILLRVVPVTLAMLMRLWFFTCRVRVHNLENFLDPKKTGKPVVASFWHYSIIYFFYFVRGNRVIAMVSASRDGEYIARLGKQFGYTAARGSRNNKGMEGLKALFRAIRSGDNCALVADGSQGPPRIAQPGAILLASRTGAPVLPMLWSADRYFTVRSWDRTVIPKPFSRIDYYYGEPIFVPSDLKADGIEEYRALLQQRLNALYAEAWGQYNKAEH
ncbi:MAG: lysophospholipid acyltransferase family protein [Pseudomonadota bacterium]